MRFTVLLIVGRAHAMSGIALSITNATCRVISRQQPVVNAGGPRSSADCVLHTRQVEKGPQLLKPPSQLCERVGRQGLDDGGRASLGSGDVPTTE